jgi:hypothetical protein
MARGGKREGAGRKVGSLTERTRAIAEQALTEGRTPLEIMLENMRHFQKVALDAEAFLESLTADQLTSLGESPEEQFKTMLAKVKQAAGFRVLAHESARDAAPFMHARLSSVEAKHDVSDALSDLLKAVDGQTRGIPKGG